MVFYFIVLDEKYKMQENYNNTISAGKERYAVLYIL